MTSLKYEYSLKVKFESFEVNFENDNEVSIVMNMKLDNIGKKFLPNYAYNFAFY